jgi:hypothetical protein
MNDTAGPRTALAAFAQLLESEWYNGNLSESAYERLNTDLGGVLRRIDEQEALSDHSAAADDIRELVERLRVAVDRLWDTSLWYAENDRADVSKASLRAVRDAMDALATQQPAEGGDGPREQEVTRRDSHPDYSAWRKNMLAIIRGEMSNHAFDFARGWLVCDSLTRDQGAAVLALREALARWLPLSQNPSIAEGWPDKYLDLVWGPNGDKANTYGQLRADLRLLSDHSAAAQQIEDEIRERVERSYEEWVERVADAIHETCRNEWRAIVAVDPGRQFTQHLTDAHYGMAHDLVRRLSLATQQPADGGDG